MISDDGQCHICALLWVRARILEEGSSEASSFAALSPAQLSWTGPVGRLARGVPWFIALYDEAWAMARDAGAVMREVTGNSARMAKVGFVQPEDWTPKGVPPETSATFKDGMAKYVTLWAALTDATPENSCLHFVPRSSDPGYSAGDPDDGDPMLRIFQDKAAFQTIRSAPVAAGGSWCTAFVFDLDDSDALIRVSFISLTATLAVGDREGWSALAGPAQDAPTKHAKEDKGSRQPKRQRAIKEVEDSDDDDALMAMLEAEASTGEDLLNADEGGSAAAPKVTRKKKVMLLPLLMVVLMMMMLLLLTGMLLLLPLLLLLMMLMVVILILILLAGDGGAGDVSGDSQKLRGAAKLYRRKRLPRFIRDGLSVSALMDLGKTLLGRRQVLPGVEKLIPDVQVGSSSSTIGIIVVVVRFVVLTSSIAITNHHRHHPRSSPYHRNHTVVSGIVVILLVATVIVWIITTAVAIAASIIVIAIISATDTTLVIMIVCLCYHSDDDRMPAPMAMCPPVVSMAIEGGVEATFPDGTKLLTVHQPICRLLGCP
ncbi:ureA [Symbiodinium sp. KB8]|nr:ureA [Symbiodinium sp. KB8]